MPPPRDRSRRSRSRSRSSSRTPSPYFSRGRSSKFVPHRGSNRSRSPRRISPRRHSKKSRSHSPRRQSSRSPGRKFRSSPPRKRRSRSPARSHSAGRKRRSRSRSRSRNNDRKKPPLSSRLGRRSPKHSRSRSPEDRARKPQNDRLTTSLKHSSHSQYSQQDTKLDASKHASMDHSSSLSDTDPRLHHSSNKPSSSSSGPIFPLESLEREPLSGGWLHYKSETADHRSAPEHQRPHSSAHDNDRHYEGLFNYSLTELNQKPKLTLHERFRDEDFEPLPYEDTITIGIHRNIKGNAPPVIQRVIDPDFVVLVRRAGEGENPFCKRDEFETRDEDVVERRTVQVSGPRHTPVQTVYMKLDGLTDRGWMNSEPRKVIRAADDDFGRLPKRPVSDRLSKRESSPSRLNSERDLSHRLKRISDTSGSRGDLRFNLSRKREPFRDARERIGNRTNESNRGFNTRGRRMDSRHSERGRKDFGDNEEDTNLPDFSKRPNKFVLEEWKEKPDMVPKGISYFHHDNRGEIDYWARRGRGRGRGRGFIRGRRMDYGRGGRFNSYNQYGASSSGPWKHDKFAEVADDGDDKPSSTTEK